MKKIILLSLTFCLLSFTGYSQGTNAFETQVADAGTSKPARYLEGTMNNLSGPRNINSWTIESWIYIPDTTITDAHFLLGTSTAAFNKGFTFELNFNKLFIRLFANGNSFDALGSTTVKPGQWNHVAATFNNSTNVIKLYLNGVEDGTATKSWNYGDINQKFFVGVQPRFKSITRESKIDEIKIWNFVKTPQEILSGMAVCQGSDSRLVTYYSFEGTTGTTVRDRAGNVNLTIKGHTAAETGIITGQDYCVPRTVYVNLNSTGANDGTSWTDAYTDLRDAFVNVHTADQIWVAKGKYTRGGNNRNASFGITGDYVTVLGGFEGTEDQAFKRDWRKNETILSADIQDDGIATNNAYSVFLGPFAQTAADAIDTCYIDGLIFQDGYANASGSAKFGRYGGGTFIESFVNKVTFNNCIWRNNTAVVGGGISVTSEFSEKDIKFINCEFINNAARAGAPFDLATFGKNQNIEMLGCLIANNQVIDLDGNNGNTGHGGRIQSYSGGIMFAGVANTTWAKNTDNSMGTDKVLLAAHKRFGSGTGFLVLENCIFSDNENDLQNLSFPAIANNGRINISANNCLVEDSTIIPNTVIKLNLMQGNASFVNIANDNFNLSTGSPAIDKGSTNGLNLPDQDLAGNQRIFGSAIDLGCYEFGGAPASIQKSNLETLGIYPNPAKNQINIKLDPSQIDNIQIIDLSGKTVLESSSSKVISVQNLTPGMYIIIVQTINGMSSAKFIKQ